MCTSLPIDCSNVTFRIYNDCRQFGGTGALPQGRCVRFQADHMAANKNGVVTYGFASTFFKKWLQKFWQLLVITLYPSASILCKITVASSANPLKVHINSFFHCNF